MSVIRKRLDEKRQQLAILMAEINLLESMSAETKGEPDPALPRARARRSSVKEYVLELLDRVGIKGLNALTATEMAKLESRDLDRGSVSSLLSRLKMEGIVTYDGERYKLAHLKEPVRDESAQGATIHPHPASGRAASA